MLPLALGVGEAEVEPLDLLVLDALKDSACVGRHENALVPESLTPDKCPIPRESRAAAARFELEPPDSRPGDESQEAGEYFTGFSRINAARNRFASGTF
jgi:hypothetical protein